jgi:pilus assembly protein Flp/PilA
MLRLYVHAINLRQATLDAVGRLGPDTTGVTAIEYGLIAGAIAVAIIATVIALGGDIKNLFATTGNALNSTAGSSL